MGTSLFIAKIFGLLYLVVGAGLILNRKAFQQIMDDFCKNTALIFFGGMSSLAVGVVIVLTHNVWVAGWPVIITIIGWIAIIKGVWLIVLPNTVPAFMQAYQKNENLIIVQSVGALIFGIVLTFFGFFAQ
jgi:hypothetical protein